MTPRWYGATLLPVVLVATTLVLAAPATTASSVGRPAALDRQWEIAAGRAVKIEVRKDGWYRVGRTRLERAGADFAAPGRLRLYEEGTEIPILVQRGAIKFYGQGRDTASTDTRTYWLVKGAGLGRRIGVAAARQPRSGFARSFRSTLDRKYRTTYSTLRNGDLQNYFGDQIYARPTTLVLGAPGLAGRSGALDVVVQGLSHRDHRIAVTLNGRALGAIVVRAPCSRRKTVHASAGVAP